MICLSENNNEYVAEREKNFGMISQAKKVKCRHESSQEVSFKGETRGKRDEMNLGFVSDCVTDECDSRRKTRQISERKEQEQERVKEEAEGER